MKSFYKSLIVLACAISGSLSGQCLTPSTVPCYEGFQGITTNNQLPACWASSGASAMTFTNGPGNYAAFYYLPTGNSYFYSNAIQLYAGVTYSIASWYKTSNASQTWMDFSMFIGPNQNPAGLVSVASTNASVFNTSYASLSNTFVVPSSGIYYAAMRGTSNGAPVSQYLMWDDLTITAPCTVANNTPALAVAASATSVCQNAVSQLTLSASGANTYTWNTGANTASISGSQMTNGAYIVIGTNTLSGCSATVSVLITVNSQPSVSINAPSLNVCQGSTINLSAVGASSFSWNTGDQGTVISVSPSTTTSYTVTGTNASGCSASDALTITVLPMPTVSISSPTVICLGETATLSANAISLSGNTTCQWQWGQGVAFSGSMTIQPLATTDFTVSVTDIAVPNCVLKTEFTLTVDACTGLDDTAAPPAGVRIYPNPSGGLFYLECRTGGLKAVEVTDVLGRVIFAGLLGDGLRTEIDLQHLPNGIYAAKIFSGEKVNQLKIVKQ